MWGYPVATREQESYLFTCRGRTRTQCLLLPAGGEAGPHPVPVEDRGPRAEGEGVWDEALERSPGDQHAAGACGAALPGLQEKGRGKALLPVQHFINVQACVPQTDVLLDTLRPPLPRSCTASPTMRSESCLPPSLTSPTSTRKRASTTEGSNAYASSMRSSQTLTV